MTTRFDVAIQTETEEPLPEAVAALLTAAAVTTLQQQQRHPPAALTLLLTDDAHLRRMNRDFLGIDAPTDVLSFPAGEVMPGMDEAGLADYLGDVAISVARAAAQAAAGGHSLAAELQLLTVHGVLHLLGHDHDEPAAKAAMWAAQTAVLIQLDAEITGPGASEP